MDDNSMLNEYSNLGKIVLNSKHTKFTDSATITINDLNNFIGADRKLVVNDTYEFWVHDSILTKFSKFFSQLFLTQERQPTKEEDLVLNEITLKKTYIDVPHPEYFFDILTWIYGQENARWTSAADEPESFLSILSLSIYLELCDIFFTTILTGCEIKLDEKLIKYNWWSRFCFTFEVLIHLVDLIPKESHFLKLCAWLSWWKEDNTLKIPDTTDEIYEREWEWTTSKEFFMVQAYIKEQHFISWIDINDINRLREEFPFLIPALDMDELIDKYINAKGSKAHCWVCRKSTNNIQELLNIPCEVKIYHPKGFVYLQRKIINKNCFHGDCKKKIVINEYPCCHWPSHIDGCMMSDGNHVIEFE